MKKVVKVLFAAVLMLAAAIAISAGDVVFQDGGLTLSQDLLVSTDVLFVDSATGNVGIGTTSPSGLLDIAKSGSSDNRVFIRTGSEATSNTATLQFLAADLGSGPATANTIGFMRAHITQATPSVLKGEISFLTNQGDSLVEIMRLDDAGNVGIGTTSPSQKLHVAGNLRVEGLVSCDTIDTDASGNLACGTDASGAAGVPSGAVMHFNLASCPSGWSELTAARGRYLVGLPSGGTLAGTAGTALTNTENRAVGQHNHGITDPEHKHDIVLSSASSTSTRAAKGSGTGIVTATEPIQLASTGITINNAGSVAGTNAPYLQLLTCQKD